MSLVITTIRKKWVSKEFNSYSGAKNFRATTGVIGNKKQKKRMSRSFLRNKYVQNRIISNSSNPHHFNEAPKNKPSKRVTYRIGWDKINWIQEPGFGQGHKVKNYGHRIVSGIVRQKEKEENRQIIQQHFEEFIEQ